MGRLAVIATLYRRPALYPAVLAAVAAQTRQPDELWLMIEDESDVAALDALALPPYARVRRITVPRNADGRPEVVPPSVAINAALDETTADYICYLTDDSLPAEGKYERMAEALDAGAKIVYVSQAYGKAATPEEWHERIMGQQSIRVARASMDMPFCNVDHTQVAHIRSEDRWPTSLSEIRWSDGAFFRDLVARFGPMEGIGEVLDYTCQLPDGISAS